MKVCYDNTADYSALEIDSYEKSLKSIYNPKTKTYIVQATGHSWDGYIAGDYVKRNEIWFNHADLPYRDQKFDLKTAILDGYIDVYNAVKEFNFVLEKDDPNYLELVEDYDRAKYLLNLTKEQRFAFWKFEYNYKNNHHA